MDWARIGRDYLDTLIWPVVALVLIILFLFWFRDEIKELIKNIRRFRGPGQLSVEVEPQEQKPEPSAIPPDTEEFEAAIKEAEEKVEKLKASEGQIAQLQALSTAYYLYWQYENTFRLIYGTQIDLLRSLSKADDPAEFVELIHTRHLNLVRKVDPTYNYAFTSFVGFLASRGFMEIGAQYRITDVGRAFLNWMKLQGLEPTNKAF